MDYLYICCLKCDSSSLSYNCIAFGLLYENCSLNLKAFNYTLLHFLSRFVIIQNAVLVEMEEIKNTKKFDSNPLTTKSDQHLISPYNITCESYIKVMRIKEMITNLRWSWLLNKFSLSALKVIYGDSMENMHTDVRVTQVESWIRVNLHSNNCTQRYVTDLNNKSTSRWEKKWNRT